MTGESNLISPQQPSFLLPGLTSTLLRERLRNWQFSPDAGREARPDARLWLTVLARQGLVEAAATVVEILVHNAVVRTGPGTSGVGRQITLRYAMTDKHNLLIDPYDPRPDFPDCEVAISGEEGRGVWTVHQMVGELFWALRDGGNVARALLRARTGDSVFAADNAGWGHWRVKDGSEFGDRHGAGALESLPAWARVRQQILGGHATGVVVINGFIAAVSEVAGRR